VEGALAARRDLAGEQPHAYLQRHEKDLPGKRKRAPEGARSR
jgi:hypothetical protein